MLVSPEATNAVVTPAEVRPSQKIDPVGRSCAGAMKDRNRRREPLHLEKVLGVGGPATATELDRIVFEAVRVFVKAYGT